MTIFIDNKKMTDKRATKFISKPDDLVRQNREGLVPIKYRPLFREQKKLQ
jgi:hypothetical protein